MRGLAGAIYLLFGLVAYAKLGEHWRGDSGWLISMFVVGCVTFISTLIHEAAHAGAAIMTGGKVKSIAVFPLKLDLATKKFGLIDRGKARDLGGFVSYSMDRVDAARRRAAIALAGPVSNLLLSGVAGFIAWLVDEPERSIAVSLMLISFAMGATNLFPFKGSDGAHIAAYWKQRRRAERSASAD